MLAKVREGGHYALMILWLLGPPMKSAALTRMAHQLLVGLALDSPRAARQNMPVKIGDDVIGIVTSGCLSPTLDRSIAMAYVDVAHKDVGQTVDVDLGRQTVKAEIVPLPFYTRGNKK